MSDKKETKSELKTDKRNIKQFIIFSIKLTLILVCTYFAYQGLFWFLWIYDKGPKAYEDSYQHALYRQYKQISNPDRDNEIIFFGSSTCAFGIDTATVKEITGMDAQIFGMESAISPAFLTKELKSIAKPGDTICCVFDGGEYSREDFITTCCAFEDDKEFLQNYFSSNAYNYELLKTTLMWRKLYSLTVAKPIESVRTRLSVKDQVYNLASFDENGNMLNNRPECFVSTDVTPGDTLTFDDIDLELVAMFNEFNSWCKENNIRFVVAYNMRPEGILYNDEASLIEYHEKMCEAFDAEIIIMPSDAILPVDNFYNSYFHLNDKGAREYSRRIAENLVLSK